MSRRADSSHEEGKKTPARAWRSEFRRRLRTVRNVGFFLLVLLFVAFSDRIIHLVPAGHAAVLFRPFWGGLVTDRIFGEGVHFTWPWNPFHIYDCRIQEIPLTVPVLAHNGLTVKLEVSARYRPIRVELPELHRLLGSRYVEKVVIPATISAVREVAGGYQHQKLFHASSSAVEQALLEEVNRDVQGKHIEFEAVLLRKIVLPEEINRAIVNKLREEERVEEYEYRVMWERLEADRKRIEGQGIQDFQSLVQRNLTTRMLYWRGIRATADLARSPNAKVVVMGSGGGTGLGLPIILGGWDGKTVEALQDGSAEPTELTSPPGVVLPDVDTGYDEQVSQFTGYDERARPLRE